MPVIVLTASFLDGNSYLSLACTSRDNRQFFNNKVVLQQVYDLNRYPFLVLDAWYYAYCYNDYFLAGQKLDVKRPLLQKLLRTLKRGKMTKAGLNSLQAYALDLKTSGEKRADNDHFLDKAVALLQGEKIALAVDLRSDLLSILEGMRECYVYTENDSPIQENVQRLLRACRRNEHNLIFELLDKHGAQIKNENINHFLSKRTDATTAAMLFAFFLVPTETLMKQDTDL